MTIEDAIKSSKTMADAARLCNMPFSSFKRKAVSLGLYTPNPGAKGKSKRFVRNGYNDKLITEEILEGKHPQYGTAKLKQRLIKEGYLENKCSDCGLKDTWNNKPIVLHLDHINGVNNDHRLDNLRLLCPNCHSQTDTWCGRGKNKGPMGKLVKSAPLEGVVSRFKSE